MLVDPLDDADVNVPGVIATFVAPATAQLNVVLVPVSIVVGAAANEVIVGNSPFGGGVLAEFPEAHPATPALTSTRIASPQCHSRDHLTSREPRFFRKIWTTEFIDGPFPASLSTPKFTRLLASSTESAPCPPCV